jgi:hypothetical protein
MALRDPGLIEFAQLMPPKSMHGTNEHLIPGFLAEFWWRGLHQKTPFWDIIAEIAQQFPLVQ